MKRPTRHSEEIKGGGSGRQNTRKLYEGKWLTNGEETGVDDGRKDLDSGIGHGNDEWTGDRGVGSESETRVVGRHQQSDDESSNDVEEEDTDVNSLDGLGKSLSGVLGLWLRGAKVSAKVRDKTVLRKKLTSSGNSDDFSSNVREGSLDEDGPETEEATSGTLNTEVLDEGSRVSPVSETDNVVIRSPSSIEDYSQDDKTSDGQDLDDCEPESTGMR